MSSAIHFVVFLSLVSTAWAQALAWGQCGGLGFTGPTTCVAGYTCIYSNPYHSQCLPPGYYTTTSSTPTATIIGPYPTPTTPQISCNGYPTTGWYLGLYNDVPALGVLANPGSFSINSSISLTSPNGSVTYLNVNNTGAQSYKPLTLDPVATTTDWTLEGNTIAQTNPRDINFLSCGTNDGGIFAVYMQLGSDPPPVECSTVSLALT